MRIAITGAAGFIGGALFRRLLEEHAAGSGWLPVAIASTEARAQRIRERHAQAEVFVLSPEAEGLVGCEVLVHAAWSTVPSTAEADPLEDLRINVEGSLRLFVQAVAAGVKRIVFISSGGTVYGEAELLPMSEEHPLRPNGAYGVSKLCVERYLAVMAANAGVEHVILRPSNVYGRAQAHEKPQGVIEHWLRSALEGGSAMSWTDLGAERDFLHVDDVVEALVAAIDSPISAVVLNVGTGRGTTLKELAGMIEAVTGHSLRVSQARSSLPVIHRNVLDAGRIAECWGVRPKVALEEGLKRACRVLQGQRNSS